MSDDEDSAPVVKKQRIQFGSLEAVERERLAAGPSNDNDDKEDDEHEEAEGEDIGVSAAVLAGIRAGNINISEGKRVTIILQLIHKPGVACFRRYYLHITIITCFVVMLTFYLGALLCLNIPKIFHAHAANYFVTVACQLVQEVSVHVSQLVVVPYFNCCVKCSIHIAENTNINNQQAIPSHCLNYYRLIHYRSIRRNF